MEKSGSTVNGGEEGDDNGASYRWLLGLKEWSRSVWLKERLTVVGERKKMEDGGVDSDGDEEKQRRWWFSNGRYGRVDSGHSELQWWWWFRIRWWWWSARIMERWETVVLPKVDNGGGVVGSPQWVQRWLFSADLLRLTNQTFSSLGTALLPDQPTRPCLWWWSSKTQTPTLPLFRLQPPF